MQDYRQNELIQHKIAPPARNFASLPQGVLANSLHTSREVIRLVARSNNPAKDSKLRVTIQTPAKDTVLDGLDRAKNSTKPKDTIPDTELHNTKTRATTKVIPHNRGSHKAGHPTDHNLHAHSTKQAKIISKIGQTAQAGIATSKHW